MSTRLPAVLLGLFVAWELVAIPLENLDPLLVAPARWNDLTGNHQGWPLFAGSPPTVSPFLTVRGVRTDGTPLEVRSRYEPTDLANPGRIPVVGNRVFNFENDALLYHFAPISEMSPDDRALWGEYLTRHVRMREPMLRAYAEDVIGEEVRERELVVRAFTASEPGGERRTLTVFPLIRWRAANNWQPEVYDVARGAYP